MKALVQTGYGSVDVLQYQEVDKPLPRSNEVLVKVCATAINDWDCVLKPSWFFRLFIGLLRPRGKFRTMGCDVAGVVESVGKEVTGFTPGDAVYGDLSGYNFGGFAEYVCVSEKHVAPMPANISFELAAALPHAAELALQAIQAAPPLSAGQQVLVNGAGGGVGTLLIQLLKSRGVETTGVDRPGKLPLLQSLGYDHVIEYPKENIIRLGKPYDLIIDTKTSEPARGYLHILKPGGCYVTVGGDKAGWVFVLGLLINRFTSRKLKLVALKPNRNLARITELVEAGELQPTIDRVYPFSEIPSALTRFERAEHQGKIIIKVA